MVAALAKLLRHTAIASLFVLAAAGTAAAVTPIDACGALTRFGETYVLTADLQSDGVCLLVAADRITIDLRGHTITGPDFGTGAGIWDGDTPRQSTTVRNGSIQNFFVGVLLEVSSNNTLRSLNTSSNFVGMWVGPLSLVKGIRPSSAPDPDCIVQNNVFGIVALDHGPIENRGQIENCVIGGAPVWGDACHKTESGEVVCTTPGNIGNVVFGVFGGSRMLITRNKIQGNGQHGVLAGSFSTITYNTVKDNGADGISAVEDFETTPVFRATRIVVTGNVVENNQRYGIRLFCPSTITSNTARDNVVMDFSLEGFGCTGNHNTPPATLP